MVQEFSNKSNKQRSLRNSFIDQQEAASNVNMPPKMQTVLYGKSPTSPRFRSNTGNNLPVSVATSNNLKNKISNKKQWQNFTQDQQQKIQFELECKQLDNVKLFNDENNKRMLNAKGIQSYLKRLNQEVLSKRMLCGFLFKKGKKQKSPFQKRWCVLISAKSLYQNQKDDVILHQTDMPAWMDLETLYYFHETSTEKEKNYNVGKISLPSCFEINKSDDIDPLALSSNFYLIKINQGDRIYVLGAQTSLEQMQWIEALRSAMASSKEKQRHHGKSILQKNIDLILDIYDDKGKTEEERTTSLHDYQTQTFAKFRTVVQENNQMNKINSDEEQQNIYFDSDLMVKPEMKDILDINDFSQLMEFGKMLNNELKNVMQACMVTQEPPRRDIAKDYLNFFHEQVCALLSGFWRKHHAILEGEQLLHFVAFITEYNNQQTKYLLDQRLETAQKVLLNTYFARIIELSEPLVKNIVELSKQEDACQVQDGVLKSPVPVDLFKIINSHAKAVFDIHATRQTGLKLAFFGRQLILQYQDNVLEMLESEDLMLQPLVAHCNNTIQFQSLSQDYCDFLESKFKVSEADLVTFFDRQQLIKQFVQIGNNSRDKALDFLFRNVEYFFKCFFLDLEVHSLISGIIDKFQSSFEIMHDAFRKKVWGNFLDKFVMQYFFTLLVSFGSAKPAQKPLITQKLLDDALYMREEFSQIINGQALTKTLKPFNDFRMLLEAKMFFCNIHYMVSLRTDFGPAFSVPIARFIYNNMRKDLDATLRKQILICVEEEFLSLSEESQAKIKSQQEKEEIKEMHSIFSECMQNNQLQEIIGQSATEQTGAESRNSRQSSNDFELGVLKVNKQQTTEANSINQNKRKKSLQDNQSAALQHKRRSSIQLMDSEDGGGSFNNSKRNSQDDKALPSYKEIESTTLTVKIDRKDLDITLAEDKEKEKADILRFQSQLKTMKEKENSGPPAKSKVFQNEGYLQKRPPKIYQRFWDRRYFRLRNEVLYWYKNEYSTQIQNKILLKDVNDIYESQNHQLKFKIHTLGKTYKFQAEHLLDKQNWIAAIKAVLNKYTSNGQKNIGNNGEGLDVSSASNVQQQQSDVLLLCIQEDARHPLFVDYEELQRNAKLRLDLQKVAEKNTKLKQHAVQKNLQLQLKKMNSSIDVNPNPLVLQKPTT